MSWYAYCITEQKAFVAGGCARRPFPIVGLKGIGGAQIFGYPSGEFAVIVSEYIPEGNLTQKAILEHASVISECFRNTTVLPFRFGTIFDHDEALRRAVRNNKKAFTESVSKLRGKAEMHIKLLIKDESLRKIINGDDSPGAAGVEYLSRLRVKAVQNRECQTKARSLSVQCQKLFHPLEEEVSCRKINSGGISIDIAHLIEHKSIEKYQNRSNAAVAQLKGCEVSVSGPWPPYHFMPGKLRTVVGNS